MPEPEGIDSSPHWDEVVDVICVGPGPGVLAYGICCAAADLDVLMVDLPSVPDEVLVGLIDAMTEDLGDPPPDGEQAVGMLGPEPTPVPSGRRATMKSPRDVPLEPFVGHRLRDFSSRCLASPYGMMFTEVPDLLTPMCTDSGESVTAAVLGRYRSPLAASLREQADEFGLTGGDRLIGLVIEAGRIAGATLDTPAGRRLVGATAGIVVSVGPMPAGLAEPPGADLDADLEVAVVGRRFGRFARLELVRR
jgi:hypothetical protein